MLKITLDQIAASLGVSKATVSRALSGKGRMAEETRTRILKEIHAAGYLPDPAARELSKRSGLTIGVSYDAHNVGAYYTLFWRALGRISSERGTRIVHLDHPLPSYARLPDGVILLNTRRLGERIAFLAERGIPAVLIGRDAEAAAYVAPDDRGAAYQAARHLLELGHRDILYLGSVTIHMVEIDRRAGYRTALSEAGIALRGEFELEGRFTVLGGYRAIRRAWDAGLRFTAVFCAGDEMAVGAIGALEDLGIRVPADVSVIGIDGLGVQPGLTTMVQDIEGIAHHAVDMAAAMVDGMPARDIIVPVSFLEGTTTGPAPRP